MEVKARSTLLLLTVALAACGSNPANDQAASAPSGSSSSPVSGVELGHIVLYQPDDVLRSRAGNSKAFADYALALKTVCLEYFKAAERSETLQVVVAVKPGKLVRVWFVSESRSTFEDLNPLRQKLEAVPAVEVFHGPIALALQLDVAGGAGPARPADGDFQPPMPQAWLDAVKGEERPMIVPDDFLALVWPDEPGRRGTERPAPPGFVNQTLEPWGGLMFRPEAWFYTEGHQGPRFMWTLAKEDPAKGAYTTGVRLQAVLGVKKHTQQTAEAFIQNFIDKKRKSAARVIKDCGPGSEQRGMTRLCLETEEGPHHIHYSLFFNNEADLAVVMTSGTTKELWPQFTATFDTMREFQLLDMKHVEAQLAKPK